ncbi:btb/poz and math domain-containing protein 1 [Holotrichia oblita]|uniref:Btb/poz and math domain-containing protein 1 n=1 Tax=Holotrichia oblita TaxID=644536 RepID=A0ACB9SMV8_HOLOL|nr:btb/poz and math domain-containing protein 1 [Holotrichia oblita]
MKLPTLFRSDSGVSDMSTHSKSKKSHKTEIPLETFVGSVHEELEAPSTSEIIFRKIWTIRNFNKTVSRRELIDSPDFRCSVNGVTTYWNMSIRFWKGPNGKRITNPLVLCLNLTGCESDQIGQVFVRFQFGTYNNVIKHWECCQITTMAMNLENAHELHSLGYDTLKISDRHLNHNKDLSIMVKIQVIYSEEEQHSLSQDLANVLNSEAEEFTDTIVECSEKEDVKMLKANSFLIRVRSPSLGRQLCRYKDETNQNINYKLDLKNFSYDTVKELFRYIYSDKVDNAELHALKLLPISTRFNIHGLTTLCERALLDTLTPSNVAQVLMIADECNCDTLKKACVRYCEESYDVRGSIQVGTYLTLLKHTLQTRITNTSKTNY